jgi:ABC-type transport system substrate-binding protein
VRASGYWDAAHAANCKRIEFRQITDPTAQANAVRAGQLDLLATTDPNIVKPFRNSSGFQVITTTPALTLSMFYNRNNQALRNADVRRAISYAIDRKSLVSAFYPGNKPAPEYYPTSDPSHVPSLANYGTYDVKKAKALLTKAGYSNGIDLKLLSWAIFPAGMADAMQSMLAGAGIRAKVTSLAPAETYAAWARGESDLWLSYVQDFGSSINSVKLVFGNKLYNPAGPTPEFDQLVSAADDPTLSPAAARAKEIALQKYLLDDTYIAPLIHQNVYYIVKRGRVLGVQKADGVTIGLGQVWDFSKTKSG